MIAYLHGKVIFRDVEKSLVILETYGVGYEVYMPMPNFDKDSSYIREGSDVSLFVYTYLREDRITLYGFHTKLQREIFSLLLDVKDIGPRLAVTILSNIDAQNLINILTTQDISALCGIKGIGQSKAERIVMELKNKILKKASVFADIKANDLHNAYNNKIDNSEYNKSEFEPESKLESKKSKFDTGSKNKDINKDNDFAANAASATGNATANTTVNASAMAKQPSDIIMESAQALESLGYSRVDSFNLASKVFGMVKSGGNIPESTEYLMKECLKYIYTQKNL